MIDNTETLHWPVLAGAYGQAERALGKLAHGLETSPLHSTWLWREITRISVTIAQAGGYHAKVDRLRLALIGAPLEPEDNTPGLAAAKRVFLTSTPCFRTGCQADSSSALWPRFWGDEPAETDPEVQNDENHEPSSRARAGEADGVGEEGFERNRLMALVRELAGFADDGRRPALINLLVDLRNHAGTRRLPPALVRIALPLALAEARLLPKAAPGLLGGRRLPLGLSRAGAADIPLNDWLKRALEDLAREADQSYRRLLELTRQHRAWHQALIGEGLRKHARAPAALDLLAATPVLSIGLVARHLGCSHVAAGQIVARLAGLGILIEVASRARHKIYVAGDLPGRDRDEADPDAPLALSAPTASVDVDGIGATLDGLFADLERLNERAKDRTRAGGVTTAGGVTAAGG